MLIGTEVIKIATDCTGGRRGFVVEIGTGTKCGRELRVLVSWTHEPSGRAMKIRTWCGINTLSFI